MLTKEKEKLKLGDYEQDFIKASIEISLAKWEGVEPFRINKSEEDEMNTITSLPTNGSISVNGKILLNIIKESFVHPNRPTIISKKTGEVTS